MYRWNTNQEQVSRSTKGTTRYLFDCHWKHNTLWTLENQSTHLDATHRCPTTKLVSRSKVKRCQQSLSTCFSSVYDIASMIRFIDPSFDPSHDGYVRRMNKRNTIRLYKRLLNTAPFLTPIPSAANLWDSSIKYSAGYSKWIQDSIVDSLE